MGTLSNGRVIEFLSSHRRFQLIQNTTLLKWQFFAVTRIQTGVPAATTQSTKHYTITASYQRLLVKPTHALTETCTSWLNSSFSALNESTEEPAELETVGTL
jgi:hypothetical protein